MKEYSCYFFLVKLIFFHTFIHIIILSPSCLVICPPMTTGLYLKQTLSSNTQAQIRLCVILL